MKVLSKIGLMILSGFILQGCLYEYWLDGCVSGIEGTLCYGDARFTPEIAQFQKPNTIGHTDAEQRWKDVEACGAKRIKGTYAYDYPEYGAVGYNKFINCVKSKGYIFIKNGCARVADAKKNGCNLTNEQPDFSAPFLE